MFFKDSLKIPAPLVAQQLLAEPLTAPWGAEPLVLKQVLAEQLVAESMLDGPCAAEPAGS